MRRGFAVVAMLATLGCTGHVPTPGTLTVNVHKIARLDGLAVNPTPASGSSTTLRAIGRWKGHNSGITHYEIDASAWSALFSRELRRHYASLGADPTFGPVLRVYLLELRRWRRGTFLPEYPCSMSVRVDVGRLRRRFTQAARIRRKWKCVRAVAAGIVRQILDDPSVRAEMVPARRR